MWDLLTFPSYLGERLDISILNFSNKGLRRLKN